MRTQSAAVVILNKNNPLSHRSVREQRTSSPDLHGMQALPFSYAHRRALMLAALGSVFCFQVTTAQAQAQANASAADNGREMQRERGLVLEEVIVTARRKEEVLTQVPASITAYSSDFLKQQNIQNFTDYATRIPNLTFQYGQGIESTSTGFGGGGRVTTIRGVVGQNTTAYYINDTPVPSSVSPQTLGLERIEVLKGPQGTLFGASSMGGNLRFITHKPSLTNNGYTVQLQGGGTKDGGADYDASMLADVVLVPGRIALNATFGFTRDSGYITRRFLDGSGQLVSKDGQGENKIGSGSLSLRMQVSDNLELTFGAMGQISNLDGFPAAYVPLPAYRPQSYTLDRDRDVQEYSKDRWNFESFTLNYSGTGFAVVSSTSYFDRHLRELEDDTEGMNAFYEHVIGIDLGDPAFYFINKASERRLTHETRLSFDEGTLVPWLSGIVGVFYQHTNKVFDTPPVVVPELAANFPSSYIFTFRAPSTEENKALFGELYFKLSPKLTATLGLRSYQIDQKRDEYLATGFFAFNPGGDLIPASNNSQSGVVPKVVLSHVVGDAGNVYASVSKGFRVGGPQTFIPSSCGVDALADAGLTRAGAPNYKPDSLWNYELGAKSRFAEGRITASAALFQIDWTEIQQTVPVPECSYNFTVNAGKARIRGGELEMSGQPFANVPLSLQIGLGYTDGKLLDPGRIKQEPNTRLTLVPELTGTVSAYYEQPISTSMDWFAAADYSYTGSQKVVDGMNGFVTRQPFKMLGANVGLKFNRSQLMLYGKNLLDERLNMGDLYPISIDRQDANGRLPRGAVSRPLQYGLQYRVSF